MATKSVLIFAILVICFATYSEAIKCYNCMSTSDPYHCGVQFKEGKQVTVVDCDNYRSASFPSSPKPTKCSKVVFNDASGQVTVRGCHFETPGIQSSCALENTMRNPSVCESCTGDLCNSAEMKYISMGTTLMALIVAAALR